MSIKKNSHLFFSLVGTFLLATTAVTTTLFSYASAVPDNKDFYLQAQNADETVDDFTDTHKQCKALESFYESQGYIITQRCHPGPNSG